MADFHSEIGKRPKILSRQAEKTKAIRKFTSAHSAASANRWRFLPLDVLMSVMHEGFAEQPIRAPWQGLGSEMREGGRFTQEQYRAAVDAAAYVHPKLAAVAYKEAPDDEREKRRNLLARIPFEQRREIAAILEAARQQEESDVAEVIQGVAEERDGGGE